MATIDHRLLKFAIGEWLECPKCKFPCDMPFRPEGCDVWEPELVLGQSLPDPGLDPWGEWRIEVTAQCPACTQAIRGLAVFGGRTLIRFGPATSLFRVLPGLPPHGPMARAFPPAFGNTGREGCVVEFLPYTPEAWVGNFEDGLWDYTGVHVHPNGRDVVVFGSGHGQVVDPHTGELKGKVGVAVAHVWDVSDPPGLVLDRQGIAFCRIGPDGDYWHTRRLSWDGFKDVALTPERITGLAWSLEKWMPFEVDLATGRSQGGAYSTTDSEQWEQLADQEERK